MHVLASHEHCLAAHNWAAGSLMPWPKKCGAKFGSLTPRPKFKSELTPRQNDPTQNFPKSVHFSVLTPMQIDPMQVDPKSFGSVQF